MNPATDQYAKNPVTESVPVDWSSEREIIAKDALRVLYKHYKGFKWGIEFTETPDRSLGMLVIRVLDIPTKIVYTIHPKDIDRDRMLCVMRGAGLLLEALGLRVGRARGDDVHGLKMTPSGLLVPHYDAMPETNPGYRETKKSFQALHEPNATPQIIE